MSVFLNLGDFGLKVQVHHMLISAVDIEGAGNDFLLKSTQVIPESVDSAVCVKCLTASKELVCARFTRVDDIDISILPSHFAIAPQAVRIVKGHFSLDFANIACRKNAQQHRVYRNT